MPKECSAKTARGLYHQLEYYREYMPYILKWSEETYAATQEAKSVDAALQAYREETGEEPTYLPSATKSALRSVLTALALLLSGCGEPPLSALINVQAKYPGAEVQMINQTGEVNLAVTRWIVKTKDGLFIVWCSDDGKIYAEQPINFKEVRSEL